MTHSCPNKKIPVSSIDGKEMPLEAAEGLLDAVKDVKNGDYEVVSNQNHTQTECKKESCQIEKPLVQGSPSQSDDHSARDSQIKQGAKGK